MGWNKDDYLAAGLIIFVITLAIVAGLYIATQQSAQKQPLVFQENQTAIQQPTAAAVILNQPIISRMAADICQDPPGTQPIKG